MSAVEARAGVILRLHPREVGRQPGIGGEVTAAAGAEVGQPQAPTHPVGGARGVVVLERVLRAAEQKTPGVGGIRRGAGRVAERHLQVDADRGIAGERREQEEKQRNQPADVSDHGPE